MAFRDTWKPRIDGPNGDIADSSAVNEIAAAVITNESNISSNSFSLENAQKEISKLGDELENIKQLGVGGYSKEEANNTFSGAYRVSKTGTNTLTLNDVDKPEHDITVSALKPVFIDFSDIKRALEKAGYTCEEIENGFIINGTNTNNELVYGYTMPNEYYPNISRVTLYCTNSDFEQNLVFMYGDGILFEPSPEPKYVNNVSSTLNLNIFPDRRITLNNAKLIFSVEELIPNIPFKVYGNSSEYTEYTTDENGQVTVKSIYPYMRMVTTSSGVNLAVEYNKDLKKAFNEIVEEMTKIQSTVNAVVKYVNTAIGNALEGDY